MKRRGRKGLQVVRGDRYALIPEEVIESASYHAQPDWARSVLLALACRFNGHNNGDLSLPFSEAKRLGISAQWKLYAGLRLLERADLIQCTRRGRLEGGRKLPSLYCLTWRGIDQGSTATYDAGVAICPIPSQIWVKWVKPPDWSTYVRQTARSNHGRSVGIPVSTTLGASHSTTLGAAASNIAQPRWVQERRFIAPNMVDTSKTLGVGPSNEAAESETTVSRRKSDALAVVRILEGRPSREVSPAPESPASSGRQLR